MSTPTFLQTLTTEVARMQSAHPERQGELTRAYALILHGLVVPSPTDPATGQVLSSDAQTTYTVNGTCSCQAGQHGKGCKHLQAWKLYQYIVGKVETTPVQDSHGNLDTPLLPEAPASANCHILLEGRQVQLTLRDTDETRLIARLQAVLARYPAPTPAPEKKYGTAQGQAQASSTAEGWCSNHNVQMQWNAGKEGRKGWYSHRHEGQWCKGR
jgi:hypothetical protein